MSYGKCAKNFFNDCSSSVSWTSLFEYKMPELFVPIMSVCQSVARGKIWPFPECHLEFLRLSNAFLFCLETSSSSQSESGASCVENTFMRVYYFPFFKRNSRSALGTLKYLSQFKTFLSWETFQCC